MTLREIRSSFDDLYRSGQFGSSVQTPINATILLPVRIAALGPFTLEKNVRAGRVFLTLYPISPVADGSGGHQHRLVISYLRAYPAMSEVTTDRINSLLNLVDTSSEGALEFLIEVLSKVWNAFFSRCDYEQNLSEQDRIAIETRVGKDVTELMRPYLAGLN